MSIYRKPLTLDDTETEIIDCDTDAKSVVIPDGVKVIGDVIVHSIFSDCTELTSIEIPNSVSNILDGAFANCNNLKSILVASDSEYFKSVDGVLFSKDMKTLLAFPGNWGNKYSIPNSVMFICNHAFSGCTGLASIEIPDSVTEIGDYAFSDCTGLTSIEIPNSVTSIGDWAFSRCKGLTSIGIPNSVTEIGNYAFSSCTALTSIEIPNSVRSIGYRAFANCISLKEMHLKNEKPYRIETEEKAFEDLENCTLYVPIGTGYAYRHNDTFKVFKEVKIEKVK